MTIFQKYFRIDIKYLSTGDYMINKLQIYISNSFDPYENLAVEKHLLDTVAEGCCTLYLWQNQNTVVIGRNQNPWAECQCTLLEAEGATLARRLSGGGAVFHDLGNLNFTFLCREEDYDLPRQMQVIQTACTLAGIETQLSGRNDILADGRKFSGNAFYNSGGKSYHHGTLMIAADIEKMQRYLTPSKAKLDAKGVKSVRSRVVNLADLSATLTCSSMKKHMVCAFEKVYGIKPDVIDSIMSDEIKELTEKYSSWDYLYGGSAPFTFSCEDRFPWGQVQLQLQVKDGIITSAKVYTDSMDWTLSDTLQTALHGCHFNRTEIERKLTASLSGQVAADIISILKSREI